LHQRDQTGRDPDPDLHPFSSRFEQRNCVGDSQGGA
jgi:hypothetical protein